MEEFNHFCSRLERQIEEEYNKGSYHLSWRLLASSAHTLNNAKIAFIGLNPGGDTIPQEHPKFAMPTGSAYVDERWGTFLAGEHPLQKQMRRLFAHLNIASEDVLAGNLVPFRSKDWHSFPHKSEGIKFGQTLWKEILERAKPSLVITSGREAYDNVAHMLCTTSYTEISAGWGSQCIRKAEYCNGLLIGLPHLSRFQIMGRPQSLDGLKQAFGEFWNE